MFQKPDCHVQLSTLAVDRKRRRAFDSDKAGRPLAEDIIDEEAVARVPRGAELHLNHDSDMSPLASAKRRRPKLSLNDLYIKLYESVAISRAEKEVLQKKYVVQIEKAIKHGKSFRDMGFSFTEWLVRLDGYFRAYKSVKNFNLNSFENFLMVYHNVCEDIISLEESAALKLEQCLLPHHALIRQVLAKFVRTLPPRYFDSSEFRQHCARLQAIKDTSEQLKTILTGFFFLPIAIKSSFETPSLPFAYGESRQLEGDAKERLIWMVKALHRAMCETHYAFINCIAPGRDEKHHLQSGERALLQIYGSGWHQQQLRIRNFCARTGLVFANDLDTFSNDKTYAAICAAMADVRTVVRHALSEAGSRTGLVTVRPPGHHHAHSACGFCNANYVAVETIIQAMARRRVLLIDIDVHSGHGTQALLEQWINRLSRSDIDLAANIRFVNTFQDSAYPYTAHKPYGMSKDKRNADACSAIHNLPYAAGCSGDEVLKNLKKEIKHIRDDGFRPDLVLYSLGMDGHWEDKIAAGELGAVHFDEAITAVADIYRYLIPTVCVTEGGYQRSALNDALLAVAGAMTRLERKYPLPVAEELAAAEALCRFKRLGAAV